MFFFMGICGFEYLFQGCLSPPISTLYRRNGHFPHGMLFILCYEYFIAHLKHLQMKQLSTWAGIKNFTALLVLCLIQTIAWAQDSTSTSSSSKNTVTTTTTTTETWYAQPWVWVVGGAVLILLLVALLRGGNSSSRAETTRTDKVTVTRSSATDTD
jgi:hypothetical protein